MGRGLPPCRRAMAGSKPSFAVARSKSEAVRNFLLAATLAVSSMAPWYALRTLPLLRVGTAKINPLDVLVLCAVLAGSPSVIRRILGRDSGSLWTCAFLGYALIPLVMGVHAPATRFEAIREARALAFYALVLVFIAGDYHSRDLQWFAIVYVAGTLVAVGAVFSHMWWLVPLPGYTPGTGAGVVDPAGCRVLYIGWTVVLSALILSSYGALTASRRRWRVAWMASSLAVGWVLLATASRATQAVSGAAIAVLVAFLVIDERVRPRLVGFGVCVALGCAAVLLLGAPLRCSSGPVGLSLSRWSTVLTDDSAAYRIREFKAGLGIVRRSWPFGEGLGGVISDPGNVEDGKLVYGPPVSTLASGYLFLLVKTGVLGLGLFFAMLSTFLAMAWANLRRDRRAHLVSWNVVAISGMLALLALNFVDNVVDRPEAVVALSLFAGMTRFDAGNGGRVP
jgi:hypothetical protein